MKQYKDKKFENMPVLYNSLMKENKHQLKKWGVQTRSLFEWQCFLTEEVGELSEAIAEEYYRKGTKKEIYNEAIQVATLALKIAEMVKSV